MTIFCIVAAVTIVAGTIYIVTDRIFSVIPAAAAHIM